jgi:AraC-like DNA-binding protein
MGADALSEVFRAVRLKGAVFFDLEVRDPWVAEAPCGKDYIPYVMPDAHHLIEYHIISEGACWGGLLDGDPVRLEAGDIIVFPQGDAHVLSSAPGMRYRPDLDLLSKAGETQLPFGVTFGGNGPEGAHIVCGFLGCESRPFLPLLSTLPRMLHLRAASVPENGWLGSFIRAAVDEASNKRSGGEGVLSRLSELMFIEVVRRYVESLPSEQTGWLAGLRDRHVGQALNLLHGNPSRAWTLDQLAKDVGLSRSVFVERFSHFVGQPPMQYLAEWRMQIAAGLLTQSSDNVASIASAVGYESEAAFSRAFKKVLGQPPAAWRRGQTLRSARPQ